MAVEMMAIAGMAPATAAQPAAAASSVGAPEGGDGFAGVIAAAISATSGEESPAGGAVDTDVSALLAGLAESLEGDTEVPVAMGDGSRLDRDAEAEGLQGALASMLLGALMRPVAPLQATPAVGAPGVAPAVTSGADGLVPVELMASVAVQAQGSAGAATGTYDALAVEGTTQDAGVLVPAGMDAIVPETYAGVVAEAVATAAQAAGSEVTTAPNDATASAMTATSSAEATLEGDAATAESKPTAGAIASTPAPAAPLATTAADGTSVLRTIEIREAQPAERRIDDRTAGLVGIDSTRPAPLDAVATASAPVVDATDGQSLASAVANSVQMASLRGDREMTLVLNPPDLGHLTVELTGDASGGLTISIHATSSEAHDLLQQHLPALRAGLEQRDVRVDTLQVDQQAPSSGPGWTDGGGRESRGRGWNGGNGSDEDGAPQWSPLASLRRASEAARAVPSIASTTTRTSALDVRA